jgi:RNA polymerase sigma factor (sigma-70 family)
VSGIVARVAAVQKEEFERLVAELRLPIFNAALARLSPEDANDVVSETFMVLWQSRDRAPTDHEGRRKWCWGIARNKILQAQQRSRRKHHDGRFVADHVPVDPASSDDPAESVVRADSARRALDALPPGEREAVTATVATDLPGREIADMLGISQTAFASRLSRGREKIARMLADDGTTGKVER